MGTNTEFRRFDKRVEFLPIKAGSSVVHTVSIVVDSHKSERHFNSYGVHILNVNYQKIYKYSLFSVKGKHVILSSDTRNLQNKSESATLVIFVRAI